MFFIIKFLLGIVLLIVFVWFGANVPLGDRTMFQHLQAVGTTRATQDLVEGTRDTAKPLLEGVRKRLEAAAGAGGSDTKTKSRWTPGAVDAGTTPADDISPGDRQRLRRVLGTGQPAR